MKKLIIFFILLSSPAFAQDSNKWGGQKWDKKDVALEATWQVIHLLDWGTTLDITRKPERYYEINPILGRHPSRDTVNLYMFGGALLHLGVTHILPPKYRPYFQGITIGMSGICVLNNLSIGLQVKI